MNLKEIINQGGTLVYNPTLSSLTADEFLSEFGEEIDILAITAKSEAGSTYYSSSTAPQDPRYGEVFSSFAQIATDIGIRVYAQIHGNIDGFFSRDPNFEMHNSAGNPVENFVCPNQETYWIYMGEIAAEIANNVPIDGIILQDVLYPRENTCFCESCRLTFSNEVGIDRDFGLNSVKKREERFEKWQKMRIEAIRNMISKIVNRVHKERKIEVATEILLDPNTNFFNGASKHFAHDLRMLSQVSPHILLHFYPWTEFPNDEQEIEELISNVMPIFEKLSDNKTSLFAWEPDEHTMPLLSKIQNALNSSYTFFTEQKPTSYLDRRSLHLELSM